MRINIPAKRRNTLRIPSDKGIFRPKRAFLGGNGSIPFGLVTEAGGTLTVLFEKVGTKKLSTEWVINNCKIG